MKHATKSRDLLYNNGIYRNPLQRYRAILTMVTRATPPPPPPPRWLGHVDFMRPPVRERVSVSYVWSSTVHITGFDAEASWWRHQMETFSALLAICAGNSPVSGEFPAQRTVTRSFDIFFDVRLIKINTREAGDLRRYRIHYDVIVMYWPLNGPIFSPSIHCILIVFYCGGRGDRTNWSGLVLQAISSVMRSQSANFQKLKSCQIPGVRWTNGTRNHVKVPAFENWLNASLRYLQCVCCWNTDLSCAINL